jgi:aldehyde:ferredoxin oxidoreductase
MMYGYAGKILRINLSTFKISKQVIPEDFYHKYMGGNGFGARLLYTELNPGINPLSSENVLIFTTGPLNGTMIPMASKFCAVSKSPLTGTFMDGFCSGRLGCELKYGGYDIIVIEGKADKPIYLFIDDDILQVRDAAHLWGMDTIKTQAIIKEELKDKSIPVACIGPAGENLVRYACIITEHRAFGSGGLGAVMGSKNLKAIAVRGTGLIPVSDTTQLEKFVQNMMEKTSTDPVAQVLSKYGTAVLTSVLQHTGALPTKNWQTGVFSESSAISAEALIDKYSRKNLSCFSCIIPCGHYSVIEEGPYRGTITNGPEFQTIGVFGSLIGNNRLDTIILADRLCDEYGIGQISAGVCIAFAMECYEHGMITKRDTDGIELRFGNYKAVPELLRKITYREGIGDILAEGVKKASTTFGKGTEDYAIHVKGMEMSCFCPRVLKTQAIGFAVASKGPSHNEVRITAECGGLISAESLQGSLGYLAKELMDWSAIANSLIWCLSAERILDIRLSDKVSEMLKITTGFDFTKTDLVKIAERIHCMERAFNLREGFGRKDDTLPKRFFKDTIPEGPAKGVKVDKQRLDATIEEYYAAMGWDKEGRPTQNKLLELGLEDISIVEYKSRENIMSAP